MSADLEKLLAEATPGPWRARPFFRAPFTCPRPVIGSPTGPGRIQ